MKNKKEFVIINLILLIVPILMAINALNIVLERLLYEFSILYWWIVRALLNDFYSFSEFSEITNSIIHIFISFLLYLVIIYFICKINNKIVRRILLVLFVLMSFLVGFFRVLLFYA